MVGRPDPALEAARQAHHQRWTSDDGIFGNSYEPPSGTATGVPTQEEVDRLYEDARGISRRER